jgi:two-component system sensor histidine kinase/response regulator
VPSIDGLDVKDGLTRVGGNRKLYLRILRDFVEGQGPAAFDIATALTRGDTASAERLAHTLKGVAGCIGAKAVQSAAGDLEKLIHDRADAAVTEAARVRVAAVLDPLVARLQAALSVSRPETPSPISATITVDRSRTREAATRMARLLSEFDPGAADLVEAEGPALRPLFAGEGWSEFEKLVHGYALQEALAQLEKALNDFPAD